MIGNIIIYSLGVISGFSLCCLICWVKIANRDDEIELLNVQLNKYKKHEEYSKLDTKVLDDDVELDKMMESMQDERTDR